MFKMLLGSNANFLCSNLPYNMNILEISKKSQPNLSLAGDAYIAVMLIKKTLKKRVCQMKQQIKRSRLRIYLGVEVREWKITKNCP